MSPDRKKLDPVQIGRVAMRHEGPSVNVYYAKLGTMEGAILLLSAPFSVAQLPGMRDKMLELGKHVMRELVLEVHGVDLTLFDEPYTAPEHERSGHA